MKRVGLLVAALALAGCGHEDKLEITPIERTSGVLSPFEAAYTEGKRLMRLDRPGLAVLMFEKAAALDPKSINALNAAGAAFDELHSPELATPYYAKALALDPRNSDTLNNMAVSAAVAGKPAEAHALFAQALAINPQSKVILANRQLLAAPSAVRRRGPAEGDPARPGPTLDQSGAAVLVTMPGDPRPVDPLANRPK